jgi:hypothetical protein
MTKIVNVNIPGGSQGYAAPVGGGRGSQRKGLAAGFAAALTIGLLASLFTACPTGVGPGQKPNPPVTQPEDKGSTVYTINLFDGKKIIITINNNDGTVKAERPGKTPITYPKGTKVEGNDTDGYTIKNSNNDVLAEVEINDGIVTVNIQGEEQTTYVPEPTPTDTINTYNVGAGATQVIITKNETTGVVTVKIRGKNL